MSLKSSRTSGESRLESSLPASDVHRVVEYAQTAETLLAVIVENAIQVDAFVIMKPDLRCRHGRHRQRDPIKSCRNFSTSIGFVSGLHEAKVSSRGSRQTLRQDILYFLQVSRLSKFCSHKGIVNLAA